MGLNDEPEKRRRKRNIQIVFSIFIGLLLFFTLYSNTLQALVLPKVRTEKLVMGSLVHTFEGSGALLPIAEAKLSNPAGWKVSAIAVKEGDRVKKGQTLITYDSKSAERELQDEAAQWEKQKIDLQNIQDRYIEAATDGDETKLRSASRDIEMRKLDLGVQERKLNELKDRLANQKKITSPYDGVVTTLNAVEGMTSTGEPDVLITNNRRGYQFELLVDASLLSSLGIAMEEKVQVEVRPQSGQQAKVIEGTVHEITDAAPRMDNSANQTSKMTVTIAQKVVRVKVVDSELKGGEEAFVKLTKHSRQEGQMTTNEAIHQDREGKFLYKIEERKGALGNDFVVRKVRIQSSETNDKETMIESRDLNLNDLIILESSEPLQEGNRVRLQ
ncbi:RND transporter [Paenibacillus selenitireducens]|uniref:RND transporter n=1 Tax=Paenibacillus selenitireducens TaxID=1324314 RepID=A0A1T2X200_9BACL|nr:HlyD family efflux transporter periplasmic adaptor subunit [Paenibacillus selenitireducens]OPA73845.1 RND transporter [Paenibacillus selenitireducens]